MNEINKTVKNGGKCRKSKKWMFTISWVSGGSRKHRMMQSKWRKSSERLKAYKTCRCTGKWHTEELSSLVAFLALDFKVQANGGRKKYVKKS